MGYQTVRLKARALTLARHGTARHRTAQHSSAECGRRNSTDWRREASEERVGESARLSSSSCNVACRDLLSESLCSGQLMDGWMDGWMFGYLWRAVGWRRFKHSVMFVDNSEKCLIDPNLMQVY